MRITMRKFLGVSAISGMFSAISLYEHELAHVNVFRYFSCDSHLSFGLYDGYMPAFYTIANNCKITPELLLAQSNVEAIGYHVMPLMAFLVILPLLYMILKK